MNSNREIIDLEGKNSSTITCYQVEEEDMVDEEIDDNPFYTQEDVSKANGLLERKFMLDMLVEQELKSITPFATKTAAIYGLHLIALQVKREITGDSRGECFGVLTEAWGLDFNPWFNPVVIRPIVDYICEQDEKDEWDFPFGLLYQ